MNKHRDLDYYPDSYADSRRRFLARAVRVSTPQETGRWQIPSTADQDLTVDWQWLPPLEKPETLFVITSGVHGSESYTGAAMQFMVMDELLPLLDRRHTGIFVVHAMNPFGFKHHRRCTENHVNLNRNASVSGSIFKLRSPASAALQDRLIPREPVTSLRSPLLNSLDSKTMDEFARIVGTGQFERPEHLEFGGFGLEPQTRSLIEHMQRLMPAYQDVIVFDIHTGLGDRGRLHLLREDAPEALHPGLFAELFDPKKDAAIYDFTPPEAEGFYAVHGSMNTIYGDLAKPGQRVCALTMEFGTLGHSLEAQIDAFNRWLVDHQGLFYGYASPELAAKAAALNFERSYPSQPEWKLEVMSAARALFHNVFSRAGCLS